MLTAHERQVGIDPRNTRSPRSLRTRTAGSRPMRDRCLSGTRLLLYPCRPLLVWGLAGSFIIWEFSMCLASLNRFKRCLNQDHFFPELNAPVHPWECIPLP